MASKENSKKLHNGEVSPHISSMVKKLNPYGMVLNGFVKANNSILRVMTHEVDFTSCVIYLLLLSHRNVDNNECFPTRELLAREANCSEKTIERSFKTLEAAGYIHIIRPYANQASRYCFPHEDFYTPESEQFLRNKYETDNNRKGIASKPSTPQVDTTVSDLPQDGSSSELPEEFSY